MLELVCHPPKPGVEAVGGQQLLQRPVIRLVRKLLAIEVVAEMFYSGNQRESLLLSGGVSLLRIPELSRKEGCQLPLAIPEYL